ncbi:MAG: response regulator [Acidobacteriia bacterium]|nr:response regulator [Terriglobia bacterium]
MTHSDEARRENPALSERSSTLNAAILRINASLDLDIVLSRAVASACELTGARYGIITTVDEAGEHQGSVYSGFTEEERREALAMPGASRLFEHLRDLPGPIRVADLSGYIRSLGLEPTPMFSRAFQAAPLRHREVHLGNFFLAEKADDEAFTAEDEEVLMLFASQAAAAVANARAHRSERQARARLEALVETSPVGVVVFDAGRGRPLTINRAARRIVEGLRGPGRSTEQLLEVISCRRADGREIPLGEFPTAHRLDSGEMVRAEEIELAVPEGRSVRTLINATPILSPDGEIESVVVTMQDLAPLDEIERQRAEFLSLVGHELRTPLTSIKGSVTTLLEGGKAVDPAERREFLRIIGEQADRMQGLISDLLDPGRIGAGMLTVAPEPTEVAELVEPARSAFQSGGGRHAIIVDLPAGLPRVMADPPRIAQVLGNLISNAARHAPESSPIRIGAENEHAHVAVSVTDEGPGVAPEQLPQLFRMRTGDGEGAGAGHGLGLAICKGLVEAHGGRIRADSAGRGTTFTFTIPAAAEPVGTATVPADAPSPEAAARVEPPRILVVDDDPQTLRFARETLSQAGYAPLVTGAPDELAHLIRSERPQLVLLDLLLPGSDGIELLQRVPELSDQPVIFISAYGRDETIARALESGAADYIVKPFSPTELVARIRAALRRHAEPQLFVIGELAIDFERRRVTVAGEAVDLTAKEFELLRVLSLHAGGAVTYETLLRRIWSKHANPDTNLVRIFVRNLRRKLGDSATNPAYLFNERGVGYSMPLPSRPSSAGGTP